MDSELPGTVDSKLLSKVLIKHHLKGVITLIPFFMPLFVDLTILYPGLVLFQSIVMIHNLYLIGNEVNV